MSSEDEWWFSRVLPDLRLDRCREDDGRWLLLLSIERDETRRLLLLDLSPRRDVLLPEEEVLLSEEEDEDLLLLPGLDDLLLRSCTIGTKASSSKFTIAAVVPQVLPWR